MHGILTRLIFAALLLTCVPLLIDAQKPEPTEITISRCWVHPGTADNSRLVADARTVFIASSNGRVEAVERQDGKLIWATDLGGEVASDLILKGTRLLVVNSRVSEAGSSSTLRSLSSETGLPAWSTPLPVAGQFYLATDAERIVLVAESGELYSFDLDGKLVWSRVSFGPVSAEPVFTSGKVTFGTRDKSVHTLATGTGETLSTRKLPFTVTAIAKNPGEELIVGDERGNVTVLNGTEKPIWKFKSGGEISRVVAYGASVVATSHDNFIYRLAMRNGDVEWKRRLAGRIAEMGFVDSDQLLTMSIDDQQAAITDIVSGKVSGQVSFGEGGVLAGRPLTDQDRLYIATNKGLHAYSTDGCTEKKEGGRENLSRKPPL